MAFLFLVTALPGCGPSGGYPKDPKVRVEGPAGTTIGYTVTYFDGKDNIDATGMGKTIPESGVYAEDLKGGHEGLLVQVIPNGSASVTVILLDGTREVQRATAKGKDETATVKAGTVHLGGALKGR
jgi:hypothetical protein